MSRTVKAFRKLVSLAIGIPILIIGIILIPLPGPGLLLCFLGLFILSREFDWAHKQFKKAEAAIKKIYNESKARADRIANKQD